MSDGLRARKAAHTRRAIQEHAVRLFLAHGYDATTVEQVAAAAGVSHMTVYRYFPTKEDLVVSDDYDPPLAAAIAARPAGEPLAQRIRNGLLEALSEVYTADREAVRARARLMLSTPALRARLWDNQTTTEQLLAAAAVAGEETEFATHVVAAACLAALTTAIIAWAEADDGPELPALIEQAFDALAADLR